MSELIENIIYPTEVYPMLYNIGLPNYTKTISYYINPDYGNYEYLNHEASNRVIYKWTFNIVKKDNNNNILSTEHYEDQILFHDAKYLTLENILGNFTKIKNYVYINKDESRNYTLNFENVEIEILNSTEISNLYNIYKSLYENAPLSNPNYIYYKNMYNLWKTCKTYN